MKVSRGGTGRRAWKRGHLLLLWLVLLTRSGEERAYADMNDLASALKRHVTVLSQEIGERNAVRYQALNRAAAYIRETLEGWGYLPEEQVYAWEGRPYRNIVVLRSGRAAAGGMVLVGAHYDTVPGTPGADDNASGVAALLELARVFAHAETERTLGFAAFTNEEPPFFRTRNMGSRVYAREARRKGEKIAAMICLEMVGYFSPREGIQSYPLPFMDHLFPATADFVAVVGNLQSRALVRRVAAGLRGLPGVGVESLATFAWIPGIDFSDHYSFYKEGYPAVMITDTAFYRNPHYHRHTDRPETLDYGAMAEVVTGLEKVLRDLAE